MSLMLEEATEAPEVVARLIEANAPACRELAARLRANPPAFVVTCARGSSDSAATYLKYLSEIALGVIVASVGPSVSSVYRRPLSVAAALFVAISQSGRSPDLLELTAAAEAGGALTTALVNDESSPLAQSAEIVLPLHAGPERSVAATKSYIASLAAILQLVAHLQDDPSLHAAIGTLPDDLRTALRQDWSAANDRLVAAGSLYVVGRGPGFAIAQEAALKLKETCGLHAEALSAADLMHGPLALTGPDFPVFLFSQPDESLSGMRDLIARLRARDVPVIAAGAAAGKGGLPVAAGLHPFASPIVMIASFYRLAEAVSRARGRDPDQPPHLFKVTETL